ncbi:MULTISPECIES: YfcZ/YiiS family protein [Pantoea]|uniref:YfcZ/YiiS family protein n=1 Tax=Pantoea TaxID=53335 RepID=UPI0007C7323C|nr:MULTISPECIES: YfcZ/YiiS family protein [Pantoea]MBW1252437.1 YfcZ/YiiS family protein [Pantoea allii]MBW1261784.1 YfcZ/YiiS family protein [Pantoea allii]MBW1284319.1 YfcZ/YiiS family protein [Pantoea allii]MCH9298238.1 YfcZ/YiiS family protein [Pantoea allii]MDJ0040716.1 YfcZ/YiiS family protein [Pantoea allii]
MTDALKKCSATETAACCCVDVGTVMDNSDCTASWSEWFARRAEAESKLARLTEKARQVESEPCVIQASMVEEADGVQLNIDFTFSCQAETLIFQLGLR